MTFTMPIQFYISLVGIPLMLIIAMLVTEYYQEKDEEEEDSADGRD